MRDLNPTVLASILASLALIGAALAGLPWAGITACGLACGVAGWLLGVKQTEPIEVRNLEGVRQQLQAEASQTLAQLQEESRSLPVSLKDPTLRIAQTARDIQQNVGSNSLELSAARRFISEYLKNTLTIVRSYNALQQKGSSRIAVVEPELAKLLEKVWQGFVKQKEHLLADDVLRLEVEMKVLQQTIENEG